MASIGNEPARTSWTTNEDVVAEVAYALILAGAALTEFDDHSFPPEEAAGLLLGGALVFMIAHAFAHALGAMTASGDPLRVDLRVIFRRRCPLVLTALPFVLLCTLAAMDRVSTSAAYEIRAGIALLALTLSAAIAVRRAGASWMRTLAVAAIALLLTAGVMALERAA